MLLNKLHNSEFSVDSLAERVNLFICHYQATTEREIQQNTTQFNLTNCWDVKNPKRSMVAMRDEGENKETPKNKI